MAVTKWKMIDTAPKDGTHIVGVTPPTTTPWKGTTMTWGWWLTPECWASLDGKPVDIQPTHWRKAN